MGLNRCDRCAKPTNITRMSWFNTDNICSTCQTQEEAHPDFAYAKAVEHEAVKNGDTNFPGVGWPGVNRSVKR
jgi:hypothetical protein